MVITCLSDDRVFAGTIADHISRDTPQHTVTIGEDGWRASSASDQPDVLLVDSRLDDPCRFCAAIMPDGSRLPVILLAAPVEDDWILRAIAAGARGVLPKSAPLADVARAIQVVLDDGVWVPRRVLATAWIEQHETAVSRERRADAMLSRSLSAREREVVRHTAAGQSNKEVATRLGISPATVKAHLMNIYQKLGMRRRGQLAAVYHDIPPSSGQRPLVRTR